MNKEHIHELAEKIVQSMQHYPVDDNGNLETSKSTEIVKELITQALNNQWVRVEDEKPYAGDIWFIEATGL